MKSESAKQTAEERPRIAAATRMILLKAKGRRLTRTIVIMVFMSTACAKPRSAQAALGCTVETGRSASMAREGPGKTQVFLCLWEIWLDSQGGFVMRDGRIVFAPVTQQIRQLFMRDVKIGIQ